MTDIYVKVSFYRINGHPQRRSDIYLELGYLSTNKILIQIDNNSYIM